MRLLVLNRFFETNPEKGAVALSKITTFTQNTLTVPSVTMLHVAVSPADRSGALHYLTSLSASSFSDRLRAYTVDPWGRFVPPLNAALEYARGGNFDALLVLSTEVNITEGIVALLASHLDSGTLVVGARLDGHRFVLGERTLSGTTTPWNTCAMWSMSKLQRRGFPLTGEALSDPTGANAGVEEAGTINEYQSQYDDCGAKLLQVPGIEWRTEELTGERLSNHRKKMESKEERPEFQRVYAQQRAGRVWHIE